MKIFKTHCIIRDPHLSFCILSACILRQRPWKVYPLVPVCPPPLFSYVHPCPDTFPMNGSLGCPTCPPSYRPDLVVLVCPVIPPVTPITKRPPCHGPVPTPVRSDVITVSRLCSTHNSQFLRYYKVTSMQNTLNYLASLFIFLYITVVVHSTLALGFLNIFFFPENYMYQPHNILNLHIPITPKCIVNGLEPLKKIEGRHSDTMI